MRVVAGDLLHSPLTNASNAPAFVSQVNWSRCVLPVASSTVIIRYPLFTSAMVLPSVHFTVSRVKIFYPGIKALLDQMRKKENFSDVPLDLQHVSDRGSLRTESSSYRYP